MGISVMSEDEGGTGAGADQAAPAIVAAPVTDRPNLAGFNRMIAGAAEAAIADVEDGTLELVHEAMRKLGAVHVAFDRLEVSLGSEIRNARDNVAAAIVNVARHIAG